MKKFILFCIFVLSFEASFTAVAQRDYRSEEQANFEAEQQAEQMSDAELAQMLAPIALYPDSLLTHILIASTYPIEIIAAYRWLKKNDSLNANQIAKVIDKFDWDASVKALVPFEQILSRLSDDLSWMQQLGDAFLQDESRVLASIQKLRYEAKHAGNLNKMTNMDVSYDDDNIIIEPREREVVYVPYYDTRMVYGAWRWSSYPPVYWTPHHRVYVNHHNPFYWHSGIRISFNYFFSTFHWHNRHVVVINPRKTHHYRPRKLITHGGYAKPWLHKPAHRRGVSYRNKVVREKYYGSSAKQNRHVKYNRNAEHNDRNKMHKTPRTSQHVSKHISQNESLQPKKRVSPLSPSVSQRQFKQHVRKSDTNSVTVKTPKVVTHTHRNQGAEKSHQQARIKQSNRRELSSTKHVERTKERRSKERHSKERIK